MATTIDSTSRGALHAFVTCGDFEHGFIVTACNRCGEQLRVPFSCKGRGFCPSCLGRRMGEGAALLVDRLLPRCGYRQVGAVVRRTDGVALPKYWLPDAFVVTDEIPRTSAEKLEKTALREQFKDHDWG